MSDARTPEHEIRAIYQDRWPKSLQFRWDATRVAVAADYAVELIQEGIISMNDDQVVVDRHRWAMLENALQVAAFKENRVFGQAGEQSS